ncbi:MAG: hypothetical protein WA810_15110 [Maribacter sp.]
MKCIAVLERFLIDYGISTNRYHSRKHGDTPFIRLSFLSTGIEQTVKVLANINPLAFALKR